MIVWLTSRRTSRRHTAFTLVELVASLAITTVLLGGIASTIVIASHALPSDQDPNRAVIDAYHATEQIADELFVAQSVTQRTAAMLEFTVADRDQDAIAETIRYEWSGTAGDSLMRTYNGGTAVTLVADVNEFALSYATRKTSATITQTVTAQSPEEELAFFDSWSGETPLQFLPSPDRWMAEYLVISPPAGVTTMNITRVQLIVNESTVDPLATLSVGIYKPAVPGEPVPQSTPIGTPAVVLTSSLPASPELVDFLFSDVVINTSETEYVIVVKASTLGTAKVRYYNWRSAPSDTHIFLWTTDGGASWDPRKSAYDQNDMTFHIFGAYESTTSQEITTNKYFLQSVDIALGLGASASSKVESGTRVLNAPEVSGP